MEPEIVEDENLVEINNLFLINGYYPAFLDNNYFVSSIVDFPRQKLLLDKFQIFKSGSELIFVLLESKERKDFIIVLQNKHSYELNREELIPVFSNGNLIPKDKFYLKSIFIINTPDNSLEYLDSQIVLFLTDFKTLFHGRLVNSRDFEQIEHFRNLNPSDYADEQFKIVYDNPTDYFLDVSNIDNQDLTYKKMEARKINNPTNEYVTMKLNALGQNITLGVKKLRNQVVDYSNKFGLAIEKLNEMEVNLDPKVVNEKMSKLKFWEKEQNLKYSPPTSFTK